MLFLVVAATAVAFVMRVAVVAATRHRRPTVAAAVDRWWVWTPLVVVCLFAIWVMPLLGLALTIGLLIALTRSGATGSPFRPRR